MNIKTTAFDIGRKLGKRPVTSAIFCTVERFLPLERVGRSERCVAFHHPKPSWDPHILVVPTIPFPAIASSHLPIRQQYALIWEMANLAEEVAANLGLAGGVTMTINGGGRQDIGQVHGHVTTLLPGAESIAVFELSDPAITEESWEQLFAAWQQAASIPKNGYSVILDIHGGHNRTTWLTRSF